MPATERPRVPWLRGLVLPALLWGVLMFLALREPLQAWLAGEERYDQIAMREWIEETNVGSKSLPEMVRDYVDELGSLNRDLEASRGDGAALQAQLLQTRLPYKREEISVHMRELGELTKRYSGQLPLNPTIYRLEVKFDVDPRLPADLGEPIVWDSGFPRPPGQYRTLDRLRIHPQATVSMLYQLHAYSQQQRNEQLAIERWWRVAGLALAGMAVTAAWLYLVQHREREGQRQRHETQQQIELKERRLLEEEVRRQEAELRQEDAERKLLEQRLATEAVEREALELKSQLYASIGIMAGSYAHNIKNLLIRPNDLLRRCLETDGLDGEQERMLHEVRQTLATVTERLQQILRTVRRDPSKSELARIDLNEVVYDITRTWQDLARDKWKLDLTLELDTSSGSLFIQGDPSHLQQAAENLLFNARDATFEMRNHLRAKARGQGAGIRSQKSGVRDQESESVRQALIAAAGWRGEVVLRTRGVGQHVVLEVQDNGIGMSEGVRRRCTETHFSTKRDNALYEGAAAGMGLGLSFVVVILEHHGAKLEIESALHRGTTFRASFPVAATAL
jgi:signal transduction histidine kinase